MNNLLIFSGFRASPTKRTKQVVYVLECDIIICLTLTITYKGHHQRPRARERERLLLPLSDSEENPFTAQGGAGYVSVCLNGNIMLMLL